MKAVISAAIISMLAAPTTLWADLPSGIDDYPLKALSRHEQGIVLVDLTVGTDGRPKDCRVLVSPRSIVLADATCKTFITRAVFSPPPGSTKASHVRAKITWIIPGCPAPMQENPYLDDRVSVAGTVTSLQHC